MRVLLVSFGTAWQAKRWREETQSPFSLLLDPERCVYRAYGLKRSAARSWHPRAILSNLLLLLKGRKLRPFQGDPNQLGGDFLIDKQGIVRFAHPSEDSADRPSMKTLQLALKFIKNAKSEGPTSA